MNPLLKILLSAILIFIISEVAKRYSLWGAVIASVPLVSVLAMVWLYHDTQDVGRIARFSWDVFWMVIPSLLLFALLPVFLLKFRMGFYAALSLSIAITIAGYFAMAVILRKCGVSL
ncbi:MAG: DUF3147 family protein [Chthoniobacterales bacterium]